MSFAESIRHRALRAMISTALTMLHQDLIFPGLFLLLKSLIGLEQKLIYHIGILIGFIQQPFSFCFWLRELFLLFDSCRVVKSIGKNYVGAISTVALVLTHLMM